MERFLFGQYTKNMLKESKVITSQICNWRIFQGLFKIVIFLIAEILDITKINKS